MLSIENLSHQYANGVQALNNLSISIPPGLFGLLGPNGAGKSTLMRSIATLQRPSSGSIRFNDIDVLSEQMLLRRQLGYLPQEFGVYPKGSAERLLHHLAILKGVTDKYERKGIIEELLVRTNLHAVRRKRVSTFSGGMLRRFGIAQALIGNPKLLIVDEPTAGLDPEERHRFNNLLSEIGEQVVVILSTHIVADVADLCSQMAILLDGEIIATGRPSRMIESLKGCIWEKRVRRVELPDYYTEYNVISTCYSLGELAIRVNSKNKPEQSFFQVGPDLEDVYFSALADFESST